MDDPKQHDTEPRQEDSFQRDGEASGNSDRRAWFEPGSVADDKLLQFEEAKQGGILDEVTKYAARSVFDKDHRKFQTVKAVGRGVKAVGKSTKAVGKGARAAGEKGARAVGRGAKAAGRGASSPLKAARDYAASRGSKAAPSTGNRSVLDECGQKNAGRKSPASNQKTKSQQRQGRSKAPKAQREPER